MSRIDLDIETEFLNKQVRVIIDRPLGSKRITKT